MDHENLRYYKIDSKEEMLDIRTISGKDMHQLLQFYSTKLKRARSKDMRTAYEGIIEQINEFKFTGEISGPPDIFVISRMMGLVNARSLISTYLGSVQSKEEILNEKVNEYYSTRKNQYSTLSLPNDQTIKDIFIKIVKTDPPQLADAVRTFLDFYKINYVKVKLKPEGDMLVVYDYINNEIMINPSRIEARLELLEALLLGLFDYMAHVNSWLFSHIVERIHDLQRIENSKFVERFFFQCYKLGLLPPPRK